MTKTVSYFRVSAVMRIRASDEVINESFLQEKRMVSKDRVSNPGSFIEFKNSQETDIIEMTHKVSPYLMLHFRPLATHCRKIQE